MAGVHFYSILSVIYIAAYEKNEETLIIIM